LNRVLVLMPLVAALVLGACTTQTNGTPNAQRSTAGSGTSTRSGGAPTSGSGSGTASGSAPASGSATAVASKVTCPGPATADIVSCVLASLDKFWSADIGRRVAGRMIVGPKPTDVPAACRSALRRRTAFTCTSGGTVYITAPYVQQLRNDPPPADTWYRFAATMAHEMGHVVQLAVHDPVIARRHQNHAASREVEQQADCLSGVWAASVGLDQDRFFNAATQVLRIVDDATERRTHGTVAVRSAAVRRGLTGRTPQSCGLTVR
jgi:predicted metalloprotease